MTFFMIILTFYGLPLNIIRDVFVTARSFITRLRALVRYHNATRDMDRRYPDATEAELAEMSDRTCIICREEMQSRQAAAADGETQQQQNEQQPPADGPNMTPKKLCTRPMNKLQRLPHHVRRCLFRNLSVTQLM